MRLTKFGLVDLPVANGNDNLPIDIRSNVVDLQYGGVDLDGNYAVLRPSLVRRNAVITNNIQTNLQSLAREVKKGTRLLRAKEIDNTEFITFAKTVNFGLMPDAAKYGCEQAITLDMNQIYPYWMLSEDEPNYLDDGFVFDGSFNFDSGNKTTITINDPSVSDDITIDNTGNAEIRKGYFVFSVDDASTWEINNLIIRNVTNGLELKYSVFSGDGNSNEVTIDWLAKNCLTETSTLDHSNVVIPTKQTDWFRLEVGENDIEVEFTVISGTPDFALDIYWSRHFVY